MKKKPLIIFDCDGVLVDSEAIECRVFSEHLQQLGLAYPLERCRREFSGLSLSSCQSLIEKSTEKKLPSDFFHTLQAATFAQFTKELLPVAGIEDVLNFLDAAEIDYCVASSGDHEKMHCTLGHTGLLVSFNQHIYSANEVAYGKPAPDLFLYAARQENYLPEQCIVIEDSVHGVQAALAAKMRVCAYGKQHITTDRATAFTHMSKLPAILAQCWARQTHALTHDRSDQC